MSAEKFNIYSMTAFAKIDVNNPQQRYSWEIRSVNQRYLEINPRLPDAFRHIETELRKRIKQHLFRGKIDVALSVENTQNSNNLAVNQQVLQPLVAAINEVQQAMPEATQLNPLEVLNWPGVLHNQASPENTEQQEQALLDELEVTIKQLQEHRLREGNELANHVLQRIHRIQILLDEIHPRMQQVMQNQSKKMLAKVTSMTEDYDEARLHQEIALLAQKADISEELDRLQTHLKEVEFTLNNNQGKPVGRRLDFLMQELNREANTIGSKSVDSQISQASVEFKVLIEQMREQVQNIE